MSNFPHGYAFDPTYGYDLPSLLAIEAPPEPDDFASFWIERYARALTAAPDAIVRQTAEAAGYRVFDLSYHSTGGTRIGGWLLEPADGVVERGIVIGHGYGGRDAPDIDLPVERAALLFPCFRGLSRSRNAWVSDDPQRHVLHGIDRRDRYILGGCVEDLWLGVSALLELYPELEGHLGYMGISFGGGIGALALPWDARIARAHLNVPTFGHQPLRLECPTIGSGAAVRSYHAAHRHVPETLCYYDAAIAAKHITMPMHVACALFDPAVAPPGQFAIHNALAGPKELFVLQAGHFDYPDKFKEDLSMRDGLHGFFSRL